MMKALLKLFIVITALLWMGCDKDSMMPTESESISIQDKTDSKSTDKSLKATGEVLVTYIANPGGHNDNNENVNTDSEGKIRLALVTFDAHEASNNKAAKGNLAIIIKNENGVVKREFKASVFDVVVNPLASDAWFLATIESDERHDGDHSGDHEDTGDASAGNGGSNGETHDDGTHEDDEHGGGCNSNDADHGNKSRLGDLIEVRVHDGGSPGTNGDLIKWKWHVSNSSHAPTSNDHSLWEEMCDKEIIAGNLVVHVK